MPQLDVSTYSSQVFWVLVCFSVLYFLFKGRFTPAIRNILVNRSDFINKMLGSARLNISLLRSELKKQLNVAESAVLRSRQIKDAASAEVARRTADVKSDVNLEVSEMSDLVSSSLRNMKAENAKFARAASLSLVEKYYSGLLGLELKNKDEALAIIDALLLELYLND